MGGHALMADSGEDFITSLAKRLAARTVMTLRQSAKTIWQRITGAVLRAIAEDGLHGLDHVRLRGQCSSV